MKRILLFLLVSLLFLSHPSQASALGGCNITVEPFPVDTNTTAIKLTIEYKGLSDGEKYWVKLNTRYVADRTGDGTYRLKEFTSQNSQIIVDQLDSAGYIIDPKFYPNGKNFQPGDYKVMITTIGNSLTAGGILDSAAPLCEAVFSVEQATGGTTNTCTSIEFLNDSFTPNDEIIFRIEPAAQTGKRRVVVKRGGAAGQDISNKAVCKNVSELTAPGGYPLGKFSYGKLEYQNYYLEIQSEGIFSGFDCGANSQTLCWASFTICDNCKSPGKGQGGKPGDPTNPVKCNGDSTCLACVEDEKNPKGIPTPLGCVKTNPAGLVSFILKFLLYTSGGIAALLIIFGGYTMMTSQGNPEKLQGARETITSAVVGLLFIIFSLVLLEIIGVDILRIPGFTK